MSDVFLKENRKTAMTYLAEETHSSWCYVGTDENGNVQLIGDGGIANIIMIMEKGKLVLLRDKE